MEDADVGHDDGDKRQSTKKCKSGVDINCGCGGGKHGTLKFPSIPRWGMIPGDVFQPVSSQTLLGLTKNT